MDVFSDAVKSFVASHFATVSELEILLMLKDNPQKEWGPLAASKTLLMDRNSVAETLAQLEAVNLVSSRLVGNETVYRFAPGTAEEAALVEQVARLYSRYRVKLIGIIATNPLDKIRTFSDAFRIRKDDDT